MKKYSDFISSIGDKLYLYGRFDYLLEQTTDCVIDGVSVSLSDITCIRRFYESTNDYNRTKIYNMINNNVSNINKVVNLVNDYRIIKSEREY